MLLVSEEQTHQIFSHQPHQQCYQSNLKNQKPYKKDIFYIKLKLLCSFKSLILQRYAHKIISFSRMYYGIISITIIIMFRRLINRSFFCLSKFQQYLRIMEIQKTSTQKQLKIKFIELAKKYHPDSGQVKDATRFKSILEAYRYLSVEDNWPTSNTKNNSYQQPKKPAETKQQKQRKRTYDYFNKLSRKSPYQGSDTGNMGYDSFFQTLKAAPELKIFTIAFIGLGIMIWVFMMTGMGRKAAGPRKVQYQKIFYSKQQQDQYRQRKKRRKQKNKQRQRQKQQNKSKQDNVYKKMDFKNRFSKQKKKKADSQEFEF